MREVKILGIVFALPPLKSPSLLFRWFLAWKRAQILVPGFRRIKETMHGAAEAINGLAKAMKDANMEEEG